MTLALQIEHLTKSFGGFRALSDVSFCIEEGEIVGLVGPNGAGKTVLLSCIAGMHRPTAGRIVIYGEDTTRATPDYIARRGVMRTFQIPQPFITMTALESVLVAAAHARRDVRLAQAVGFALEALESVGLSKDPNTPVTELNTIELKLVDLARALSASPRILLLDELAAGLMTGELANFIDTIMRIARQGRTLIVVEHVLEAITNLCPRVIVLDHGRVIADGPTRDVMADSRVAEAYLGMSAS